MIINKILGILGVVLFLMAGTFILASYGVIYETHSFSYNRGTQSRFGTYYLIFQVVSGIVIYFLITKGEMLENALKGKETLSLDDSVLDYEETSVLVPGFREKALILLFIMVNVCACFTLGFFLWLLGNRVLIIPLIKHVALFHLFIGWELIKLFWVKNAED